MSKFKVNDRVAAYGTDESTKWFATGNADPYRVTGTVIRTNCYGKDNIYKIEIDNSGSQDSEGNNAVVVYHEKQMELLNVKN
jgi:hypothetical protein